MPLPKPITIRGVTYPSRAAAAQVLGIQVEGLYDAIRRGTVQNAGLGQGKAKCIPITIRGVTYPSYAEAARALGVSPSSVQQAVKYGYEQRVGLGREKKGVPSVTTYRGWALFVPYQASV